MRLRLVHRLVPTAVLATSLLTACDNSAVDPVPQDPGATLTVDASSNTDWALVALASPAQVINQTTPATASNWDVGFQVTSVIVNGGASGPGEVVAHCLCQNEAASGGDVMAFTAASEEADFQAVTAAAIPAAGSAWSTDAFDQKRWYRYNLTGSDHQIWPTYDVYLVKRGTAVYKVQLTGYYGATGTPRQITLRYAKLVD